MKATRISGIKNFHKDVSGYHPYAKFCAYVATMLMSASFGEQDFGLIPLKVATWGPFVLISLEKDCLHQQNRTKETVENEWLGHASEILSTGGIDSSLKHVCRREYTIQCNWKVYCSMLQIFPVIHFLTNLRYLIMPLFLDLFFIVNSF